MRKDALPFLIVCSLGCFVLLSCAATQKSRRAGAPNGEQVGEHHWVQGARLRAVMARIGRITSSTWPQEVANEYTLKDQTSVDLALADAKALADKLAVAASSIPDSVHSLKLSEADRRAFDAQASTLQDQSYRLRDAALDRDLERMRQELDAISATCHSCHERFRDVSGPMTQRSRAFLRDQITN